MSLLRRICLFLCVVLYTLVIALAITSLTTQYWYSIRPTSDEVNNVNSTFTHAGLFVGENKFDLKLESFKDVFYVRDDIAADKSYLHKFYWVVTVFFIGLGLLGSFIGLAVSMMSTVIPEHDSVFGHNGIHVWSIFSIIFYLSSLCAYLLLFNSRKRQLHADYSPFLRAQLDFSFYLIIAAVGVLFMPIFLMIISKTRITKNAPFKIPIDKTVFLY